jgi:hypothetical protein
MARGRTGNAKRVALMLWVLVAFFYFYLSYNYIHASMSDKQFADYVQYVVQIAGNEGRSAKDVRDLVLVKAEELALPVSRDQILVSGAGQSMNVVVHYNVEIEIPLIQREIYSKTFEHNVRYRAFR